jgi:tripartite-type tricarboxylate transporter receptor subunit TctC
MYVQNHAGILLGNAWMTGGGIVDAMDSTHPIRSAKEVARAVKDPNLAARLASNGVDPLGNSPEEFAAMIAADIAL